MFLKQKKKQKYAFSKFEKAYGSRYIYIEMFQFKILKCGKIRESFKTTWFKRVKTVIL